MISVQKCRQILGPAAESLSEEDILTIRDGLYELAQVTLEIAIEQSEYGMPSATYINKALWL